METTVLQRMKESISVRMKNISDFLQHAPPQTVELRVGPISTKAIEEELSLLKTAMQKAEDNTLGLCTVCDEYVDTVRLEMDYTASVCLDHLSGPERTMLEYDLELSAKVQQALLPHTLPRIRNIDMAAYSQPARIVGGDYFDFLRFKDGSHAIIIADVMGKGMPASMLMASLQASLRIIAPENNEPAEVVARLNHLFCHNIRLTNFVTLFLAKFNEQTRVLTYCNAGHNPPMIRRNNGSLDYLQPSGAAIGLIEQTAFEQGSVVLSAGESLLMYTDGVVESMNNQREQFGQERLEEFFMSASQKNSQQIITDLKETLRRFSGVIAPADDTTIVALRMTG